MNKLPTLDLFSGIGGNAVALNSICSVIAYCDNSPRSQAVIRRNMEKGLLDIAPVFDDVTKLRGAELTVKPVMITAGFPCQDASCANPHGKGIYGPRTGLFFEVMRLIDELPTVNFVLLENTPCIASESRGLPRIEKELRKRGFNIAMGFFGTWQELGALHDRRRWICLCVRNGAIMPSPTLKTFKAWNQLKEPVSRLIHGTEKERRVAINRCKLLGNSVVPQQICRAAYELTAALQSPMSDVITGSSKEKLRTDIVCIHNNGTQYLQRRVLPDKGGRDLKLSVGKFQLKKWSSPMHTGWTPYGVISQRASRLLCVQIFREANTNYSEKEGGFINPLFIEHLMGYPKNWTYTQTAL